MYIASIPTFFPTLYYVSTFVYILNVPEAWTMFEFSEKIKLLSALEYFIEKDQKVSNILFHFH